MLRLIASVSLVLLVAMLPASIATSDGEVSCYFASNGPDGVLGIANAPGRSYSAVDAAGRCVSSGLVTSAQFAVPVVGVAPGPLAVHVGTELLFATSPDRAADWQ